MPRLARYDVLDPGEVQVLHCVQRCVRRALLCGEDSFTGQSFEHRREWIRARLESLASVFGIDCLTYTVLSNHLHLVLRSRPDVVSTWTDEEVARRWLRLFPKRREKDGSLSEPTRPEIDMIVNQPELLTERRKRLSDVSWWMRCAAENIARRANREDECTGRFWEGRFKVQLLLDEALLLACAAYVGLNPIRAALAETPEESDFTGAKDRIDDLSLRATRSRMSMHDWERSRRRKKSGWIVRLRLTRPATQLGRVWNSLDAEQAGNDSCPCHWRPIWNCWIGRGVSCDVIKRGRFPNIWRRYWLGSGWTRMDCAMSSGSSVSFSTGRPGLRKTWRVRRSDGGNRGCVHRRTRWGCRRARSLGILASKGRQKNSCLVARRPHLPFQRQRWSPANKNRG